MESVIISQKKLAVEMFYVFSMCREVNGRVVQPYTTNDEFCWQIHPIGYYESDENVSYNPDATIVYKISNNNIALRASINDMMFFINEEFDKFKKEVWEYLRARA